VEKGRSKPRKLLPLLNFRLLQSLLPDSLSALFILG